MLIIIKACDDDGSDDYPTKTEEDDDDDKDDDPWVPKPSDPKLKIKANLSEYMTFMSTRLRDKEFYAGEPHKKRWLEAIALWNSSKPLASKHGEKRRANPVHIDEPPVRPKAKAKTQAKTQAKTKLQAKSKPKAKPIPGLDFGCPKCRWGRTGCAKCNPAKKKQSDDRKDRDDQPENE